MKILIASEKEWEDMKGSYKSRRFHQYYFEDENKPKSFPCVLVESSSSIPDSYSTEYHINFVYLTDFQNENSS